MAGLTWANTATTTGATYNYDTSAINYGTSTITSNWPDWDTVIYNGAQYRNVADVQWTPRSLTSMQSYVMDVDCINGAAWDEESNEYRVDFVIKGVGKVRLGIKESYVEVLLSLLDRRFKIPTDADMDGFFDPE